MGDKQKPESDDEAQADARVAQIVGKMSPWAAYVASSTDLADDWEAGGMSETKLEAGLKAFRANGVLAGEWYAKAKSRAEVRLSVPWCQKGAPDVEETIDVADTDQDSGIEDDLCKSFAKSLKFVKPKAAGSKPFSAIKGDALEEYFKLSKLHHIKPRPTLEASKLFRLLFEYARELYLAKSAIHIKQNDNLCASEIAFTNLLRTALDRSALCRAVKINNAEIVNADVVIGKGATQFSPSHGKPGDLCLAFKDNVFRAIIEVKVALNERKYWAEALAEARALSLAMGTQPMVILLSPFHMTKIHYELSTSRFWFEDVAPDNLINELYTLLKEYHDCEPLAEVGDEYKTGHDARTEGANSTGVGGVANSGPRGARDQRAQFVMLDDSDLSKEDVMNERRATRRARRRKAVQEPVNPPRFRIVARNQREVEQMLQDDLQLAFLRALGKTDDLELPVVFHE